MVEMLAYAFGIMYTPGPVNILSLNAGLQRQARSVLPFSLGVATAMLLLFLIFAYTGSWLLDADSQLLISAVGSVYIVYLAIKILRSSKQVTVVDSGSESFSFKSGLALQLLNPKSFIVILPIVAVQFPAANISGIGIPIWCLLLSVLAFGAPLSYCLAGVKLGAFIRESKLLAVVNVLLALLLLYVAIDIAYSEVYLQWIVGL